MLTFADKILCRKVGKIFENSDYNIIMFPEYWLKSDINKSILNYEASMISQSPLYILHCFDELYSSTIPKTLEDLDKDSLFWFGYILTYIQLYNNISGDILWKKYDVIEALKHYDVLHTVSCKVASDMILHDYNKVNMAKLKIFGDYVDISIQKV